MQRYVVRHGRRIAIETMETGAIPRRRQTDPFVKVPLRWAAKAAKATRTPKAMVWLRLLYAAWKAKSSTFSLPNEGLKRDGISRFTKYRALCELEQAGLITVERRRQKALIITLLGWP